MNDSVPLVSIVVPAHNAAATLAACLEACLAQTYPATEVLVVDDGSADDTKAIAERLGVRCISQRNQGPAAARNRGAAESSGPYIAFTDSDCVPEPEWIVALTARMAESVGAAGGTYTMANPHSLLAQLIHHEIEARHQRFGATVDFLGSFNVVYRRDAFDGVDGFDTLFTNASAEDNDIAYRLTDAGWSLAFTRDARVAHYHPERLGPYLRTQARHGYWRVVLYRKHPGRKGGDHYAGLLELLRPPLFVVAVAITISAVVFSGLFPPITSGALLAASAAVAVYFALAFFQGVRLMYSKGLALTAAYIPLLIVRDAARVLGLIGGMLSRRDRGST